MLVLHGSIYLASLLEFKRCREEAAAIMLLSWSNIYIKISSSQSQVFLKFWMLRERSSDIACFVEHPVYSSFKMYSVLILVFYFDLPLLMQNVCLKVKFSWTSRRSAKQAVILLHSWSTLYIAFSKCKVSWFLFLF